MNFFKSVFSDDLEPKHRSAPDSPQSSPDDDQDQTPIENDSDPNPRSSGGAVWSFDGLIKTFATKSESVLQTYRRDLEEFRSGLKKETEAIREVASRAVKELPVSIEAGASVAQGSLESVGQAIDDFGSSLWRGTGEIISNGSDVADFESDSSDCQYFINQNVNSNRYSRLEAQVHAIQTDLNTYCEDPEDLDDLNVWKLGFVLEEKDEEIENLCGENGVMEGIYTELVPNAVDHETFWTRYFYRVYKLNQVEDARANLVKRVISGEEEDLSWDVEDDDHEQSKGDASENKESENKGCTEFLPEKKPPVEESLLGSSEVVAETRERVSDREINNQSQVLESISDSGSDEVPLEGKADPSVSNGGELAAKFEEKAFLEGRTDPSESSKDSDFSVISTQPSLPEEEEIGWDEIEDLGSIDEQKIIISGSPNRAALCKRLSAADEEEDLSWDFEDEDEPVKP